MTDDYTTRSVYDPARHSPDKRLRFANAALLISAQAYLNARTIGNFNQMKADGEEQAIALSLEPKWEMS
jgi:hypothetical protein